MQNRILLLSVMVLLMTSYTLAFVLNIEVKLVKKNGTDSKTDLKDLSDQFEIFFRTPISGQQTTVKEDYNNVLTTKFASNITTRYTLASNSTLKTKSSSTTTKSSLNRTTSAKAWTDVTEKTTKTSFFTKADGHKNRTLPKIIDNATTSRSMISNKTSIKLVTNFTTKTPLVTTTYTTRKLTTTRTTEFDDYSNKEFDDYQDQNDLGIQDLESSSAKTTTPLDDYQVKLDIIKIIIKLVTKFTEKH